ncbi:MAG: MBL fold metallo-hydrolase, partial [Mucilaginibacter sp.]
MSLSGAGKKGGKFLNPIPTNEVGFGKMIPLLKEYYNNEAENTPRQRLGPFETDVAVFNSPPDSGLRVTLIGHSSLLIEIDGKRILTDPVWSDRVSFSSFFGPKRFFQPPFSLKELPPLDAVIISHDHYDHLDRKTIKFFAGQRIPFICSLGVGKFLRRWGIERNYISELDWGDGVMLGVDCNITATPARHFSGRGIVGRNETLWSSFVIKGHTHNIFFGADS